MKPTIIIPTYNYGHYIGIAIDSVLAGYDGVETPEIIVVDDGSTDDTRSQLQGYVLNQQIQYHALQQGGKAAATRKGIEMAKGDIIFTLDADDYFLPGKIAATLDIFNRYPGVQHVASPALYKWEDGSHSDETEKIPGQLLQQVLVGSQVLRYFFDNRMLFGGGSTFAARTAFLKQMPLPNEVDMYTDEWLVLQALLSGNTYFHPHPLSVWRIHGNNFSVQKAGNDANRAARMLKSSECVLQCLQEDDLVPDWLKKTYHLKHAMRIIENKRKLGNSPLMENWKLLAPFIFGGRYSIGQLWRYGTLKALLH